MARRYRSISSLPSFLKFSTFSLAIGISPSERSSLIEEDILEWKLYIAKKGLISVVLYTLLLYANSIKGDFII